MTQNTNDRYSTLRNLVHHLREDVGLSEEDVKDTLLHLYCALKGQESKLIK